ncbi:MAG: cation:proton antiporter [Bacilli bacterium]
MTTFITIFLIANALYFFTTKIEKKFFIPCPLQYLLIGLMISFILIATNNSSTLDSLNSNTKWNTFQSIGIYLLFFSSGFKINFKQLFFESTVIKKLSFFPAYVELAIMLLIMMFINTMFFNNSFHIYELLFVTSLFAMSSPANVIPISNSHMKNGYTGKNHVTQIISTTSILDNVTVFPITIILLPIIQLNRFSIDQLIGSLSNFLVLIFITIFFSLIASSFYKLIVHKLDASPYIFGLISFTSFIIFTQFINAFTNLGETLSSFSFIIAIIAGAVIANRFNIESYADNATSYLSSLFSKFFMPIIFLSVGLEINFNVLFNIPVLIICVGYCFIALLIKINMSNTVLRSFAFQSEELKYAATCFIPKGVTLINFSIILLGFTTPNYELISLMTTLGTVGILLTLPLGISLMTNKGEKWLT